MGRHGDDISRAEAVHILLGMLNEIHDADPEGKDNRGVALMMAITALACISTEKLYELAAQVWTVPDTEVIS